MPDPKTRPQPLQYHERTQMALKPEENILQQELDRFETEVTESNLVINDKKSFVMVCNPSKKCDFPPEFKAGNSKILEQQRQTIF